MNFQKELHDRPIFICGHPKAGTSLVRALLDSHPQLLVYPEETIFFRRYLPESAGMDIEEKIALAQKRLIHIFTWNAESPPDNQDGYPDRDYSAIQYETVRNSLSDLLMANYRHDGDILSSTLIAYGVASKQINPKTAYWVEKSPYNEYYAGQIFNWWPEARCLHVVRDPRDNYLSYRRKHPDWSAEFFANNWNRSTLAGLKNQENYGKDRCLMLRYEDLVNSPQKAIDEITSFLQVEWHESLTAPTRAGEGWAGNSMFADRFQKISAAPVGRWRKKLDAQDAVVIELMTRERLLRFDYERPHSSNNDGADGARSQAAGARWRVFTWPARKHFYHRRKKPTSSKSPLES